LSCIQVQVGDLNHTPERQVSPTTFTKKCWSIVWACSGLSGTIRILFPVITLSRISYSHAVSGTDLTNRARYIMPCSSHPMPSTQPLSLIRKPMLLQPPSSTPNTNIITTTLRTWNVPMQSFQSIYTTSTSASNPRKPSLNLLPHFTASVLPVLPIQ
jgi:hypothetical protein